MGKHSIEEFLSRQRLQLAQPAFKSHRPEIDVVFLYDRANSSYCLSAGVRMDDSLFAAILSGG